MRTIEEIQADIDEWREIAACEQANWAEAMCELAKLDVTIGGIPEERLKQICQAEKEGRLVVLPCKVGDTVWYVEQTHNTLSGKTTWDITEKTITELRGNKFNPVWFVTKDRDFHPSQIGKTVFLTRAQAEAALEAHNEKGMD